MRKLPPCACLVFVSVVGSSQVARADPDPPSTVHVASGVAAGAGAALALTALIVPLAVCHTSSTTDSYGATTVSSDPCDRLSNGAKIAWIAGGGLALTLAVVGGIVFFMTARSTASTSKGTDRSRFAILPFLTVREGGNDQALAPGVLVTGTF